MKLLSLLLVSSLFAQTPSPEGSTSKITVKDFCLALDHHVKKLDWKEVKDCAPERLKSEGTSVEGRPLVYEEFGPADSKNTTLIFSMVHSDEITPLYLGLQLMEFLRTSKDLSDRVVIAPIVNPDGFFRKRTRTNSRGVDVNRNFDTPDWRGAALSSWKKKYRSDPRRFPGSVPDSEPETVFQKKLIEKFKPNKIISIHSPLNFLDYDGPNSNTLRLNHFSEEYLKQCEALKKQVKAASGGYFPGSLGNYAGRTLGIPTFTLELPTSNPRKAAEYWKKFQNGIRTVIEFDFIENLDKKKPLPQ